VNWAWAGKPLALDSTLGSFAERISPIPHIVNEKLILEIAGQRAAGRGIASPLVTRNSTGLGAAEGF
jgi:hypothetical protein